MASDSKAAVEETVSKVAFLLAICSSMDPVSKSNSPPVTSLDSVRSL